MSARAVNTVTVRLQAAVVALALSFCALVLPPETLAQKAPKVARIGYLYGPPVPSGGVVAFEDALRELGWVKDRNLSIHYRSAEGYLDRLPELAVQLVRERVHLIVANAAPETKAAREATPTLPIVFVLHGDPVETGDVQSLARPGGNVTGVSQLHSELSAKQLEVLKQIVPRLGRVDVLWNAEVAAKAADWRVLRQVAPALGITLQSRELRRPDDLEGVLSVVRNDRPDALLILGDPMLATLRVPVAKFAVRERLPAMYPWKVAVQDGGLVSYGADLDELRRRAAWYVDRILKGAKPADLPVQQPDRFELAVNLKAAKRIGLVLPQPLLLRADHVID